MKNIIHHVHSKPEHIRHWVAIGCTAAVGAVVIGFWFHSFQNTTYALLNPGQQDASPQDAAAAESSRSLFSSIGGAFTSMKAEIGGLFSGSADVQTQTNGQPAGPAHPLPVSADK